MQQLRLARTILLGDQPGSEVKYEIYGAEGERPNYVERIIVYRQKVYEGFAFWGKTDEHISLEHLDANVSSGIPTAISDETGSARNIVSAVIECQKHYEKTA